MGVKIQIILLWLAVALYAAASVAFAWKLVSMHVKAIRTNEPMHASGKKDFVWGIRLAFLALLPHTAALLMRWLETGHGPYMRVFEVYSSDVWVVVVMYLLLQYRWSWLRLTGVIVLPSSFLLIGLAVMASPEIRPLPATFGTFWLVVHIAFAKLAYGANLVGTSLAVFYLLKERRIEQGKPLGFWNRIPDLPALHEQSYQFIAFGFIMLGIMLASGAIWANKAWGSYWSWDPVETWSLISWLLYGVYLHLVRTYGWQGRRPAWLAIAAIFVMAFAIFGLGLVYQSLHSPYIR